MKDSDLLHPDLLDHDLLSMTREEFLAQVNWKEALSPDPYQHTVQLTLLDELYSEGFSPDEALEIIEYYTFPLQSTPE